MLKFSLLLVALAFLTTGILRQNGYLDGITWTDLVKQVTQGHVKYLIRKEVPKQTIPESAVPSPTQPRSITAKETHVSGKPSSGMSAETIPKGTTPPVAVSSGAPKPTAAGEGPGGRDQPSGPRSETGVKEVAPPSEAAPAREDGPSTVPVQALAIGETVPEPRKSMAEGAAMSSAEASPVPVERVVQGAAVIAVSKSLKQSQGVDKSMAPFKSHNPPDNRKSYPYSLYFGSFRTLERAKRAVSIYSREGLSPYWVKVSLSSGSWYRVYGGHFTDSEQAEDFRLKNGLRKAEVKKTPYANLIGTYASAEDVEDMISSLKDRGFSPYVIEDDRSSRLYVGAFSPIERAERTSRDLEASGIPNRIVSR